MARKREASTRGERGEQETGGCREEREEAGLLARRQSPRDIRAEQGSSPGQTDAKPRLLSSTVVSASSVTSSIVVVVVHRVSEKHAADHAARET